MTRTSIPLNKIALLATGDELINGDILNTNSQEIARRLFKQGFHVGTHMVTADTIIEIEQAIRFLLQTHSALIITGGLGPTSDDLTRFALSNAVSQPLKFDEASWENITRRLKLFGYDTPPLSNRQQALFPEGAVIIPNPNGTAAGCIVEQGLQLIFMLPGPPPECLPMFETVVLERLQQAGLQQVEYHQNWLLFGVSEGQIAEELDAIAKPYQCVTGYRLCYPYIEFKLHSNQQAEFEALLPKITTAIQPYLIEEGRQTAAELLRQMLEQLSFTLSICDLATGGLLESTLKTPENHARLRFMDDTKEDVHLRIEGLAAFWQQQGGTQTQLNLKFNKDDYQQALTVDIPFRGARVKTYAVEFICKQIYHFLVSVHGRALS